MIARERGAERCNDIRHARLPRGDGIHIALNHDRTALARNTAMCTVKTEEQPAFVKYGRFRRIQILRLRVTERAPAESDNASALIRDGDDDTIAEPIVDATAALPTNGEPRRYKNVLRYAALLERIGEL